ncbi:MAG: hypothetical protein IT440_10370 [Phycisphaeraceae bacterium]|nr:hypothetical protein [Phycisphaeraceae bacterium]
MNVIAAGQAARHAVVARQDAMSMGFAAQLAASRTDETRQAAEQLVASTLVMPILSQMRQDPFRTEMFHGGFGEDAFNQQLDTVLSDRIVKGSHFSVVEAVCRRIAGKNSSAKTNGTTELTKGTQVNLHG